MWWHGWAFDSRARARFTIGRLSTVKAEITLAGQSAFAIATFKTERGFRAACSCDIAL